MIALLLAAGAGGGAGCGAFATGVSAVPELATSPVVAGAVKAQMRAPALGAGQCASRDQPRQRVIQLQELGKALR